MLPLQPVGQTSLPGGACLSENPQDQRVSLTARNIFESLKQNLLWFWRAFVMGIQATTGKIGIVFFNALFWIHPTLGHYAETITLRICNIWQEMQRVWREEEVQKTVQRLQQENETLKSVAVDLTRELQEKAPLAAQHTMLTGKVQFLEDQLQNTDQQREQANLARIAANQSLLASIQHNKHLVQENTTLKTQLSTTKELVISLDTDREHWKARRKFEEEGLTAARELVTGTEHLQQQIHELNGLGTVPESNRTGLDQRLEALLQNIQCTLGTLEKAQTRLPVNSTGYFALQSAKGALTSITQVTDQVLNLLKFHSDWNPLTHQTEGETP